MKKPSVCENCGIADPSVKPNHGNLTLNQCRFCDLQEDLDRMRVIVLGAATDQGLREVRDATAGCVRAYNDLMDRFNFTGHIVVVSLVVSMVAILVAVLK